jgi:hypothetical protein
MQRMTLLSDYVPKGTPDSNWTQALARILVARCGENGNSKREHDILSHAPGA